MGQIHKRFTGEQVRLLFGACIQGHVTRMGVQEAPAIGQNRFYGPPKEHRLTPRYSVRRVPPNNAGSTGAGGTQASLSPSRGHQPWLRLLYGDELGAAVDAEAFPADGEHALPGVVVGV
jgi:hypothetical protein